MSVSLKISIGNKEYNVIGEDENLIRAASEVLNKKITEISDKNTMTENLPILDKTTLAALNIAESNLKSNKDFINNTTKIIEEINKITDYLDININNQHL